MLTDELEERNDANDNLNVNKMVKYSEFDTSQVISEARLLLHCDSPIDENHLIISPKESPMKTGGISNRHINMLPAIKKTQTRKSVRFNMEKNVTFNVQTDIYHSPDSDSDSTAENERNFKNANDLGISDEDSEDDDSCKSVHKTILGITSTDKRHIMGEIDEMERQKVKLAKELEDLRIKHEKEMKQLRDEYNQRREDYYDELDDVQKEMNQKRNAYNVEFSQFQDVSDIKQREEAYNVEKRKVEEKEEELKQKKEHISEQERELKEYEAYLERRHKSLNKKEEDLCMLQDELEELNDVLREEEKRQKSKQERLMAPVKVCNHDDADIEKTRILLNNSLRVENELLEKLKKKDEELDDGNATITNLEEEKRKLEMKMKHLESQVSFNRVPSPSHFEKQVNFKLITSTIPVDEKTGECIAPKNHTSTKRGSLDPGSPRRLLSPLCTPELIRSKLAIDQPSKCNGEHSDRITSDDDTINDEIKEIEETSAIYAADTTPPRRTHNKSNFSKTCVLM